MPRVKARAAKDCAGQATAHTKSNTKGVCGATDIVPYNLDTALTKLPGYKTTRVAPEVPTTPQFFKLLHTPLNRRELRQQTLSATDYDPSLSDATEESSITLLRRLDHQSESVLMRCQIAEIEAADTRQK